MMTINKNVKKDLRGYVKQTLSVAVSLLVLLAIALAVAIFADAQSLVFSLAGGLVGVTIACANLFALGYAFFIVVVRNGSKWTIIYPLLSFVLMGITAFVLVKSKQSMLFGFALGLTAPVIVGAVIAKV